MHGQDEMKYRARCTEQAFAPPSDFFHHDKSFFVAALGKKKRSCSGLGWSPRKAETSMQEALRRLTGAGLSPLKDPEERGEKESKHCAALAYGPTQAVVSASQACMRFPHLTEPCMLLLPGQPLTVANPLLRSSSVGRQSALSCSAAAWRLCRGSKCAEQWLSMDSPLDFNCLLLLPTPRFL